MMFVAYRANVFVSNLERSTRFYCDVLGFQIQMHDPNFGLTMLERDKAQLALVQADQATPHQGFAEGYLEVVGLDEVLAQCQRHKVRFTQQPTTHHWNMRDFVILDPDGYAIAIGERVQAT